MTLSLRRSRAPGERAPTRAFNPGVAVLLGNTLLMNFGFSMLIPLLALHFTGSLGFTAASIGLVLALRQVAQQGLDLVGGLIADRIGARTSIVIGCFVRAAGFLGVGVSHTLPTLLTAAVVSGIGGAFFDAPGTAALADLVMPANRQRAFAASATMGNVGGTVGPVLGVALLGVDFMVVSIAAAVCFVAAGTLTWLVLPATALRGAPSRSGRHRVPHAQAPLAVLLRDRTFVALTALLAGFWFLWAQINITVPLRAASLGGAQLAAIAFAINAAPAIALQYPLARYIGKRFHSQRVLAVSLGLCGAGMVVAFAAPGITVFLLGVLLFALARMVIWPTINTVTAERAPAGMLGAYFGFGALAIALGAGTGQVAGGWLYDLATRWHQPAMLYGSFGVIGLAATIGLTRLRFGPARPTPAAAAADVAAARPIAARD
ncbi:MAG TPA: MFS transporter [Ktedonobacterales bacterium]|nr:MFS transporter [Ktedonobacterales bacterium]